MCHWFILPAELKQYILCHVLDDMTVKFAPRHASTRSTKTKSIEQSQNTGNDDMVSSLLLISKTFVTYRELEPMLLCATTISLENERSLTQLTRRYTDESVANISKVLVTTNRHYRYQGNPPRILSTLLSPLSKFKGLLKITIASYPKAVPFPWSQCFTQYEIDVLLSGDINEKKFGDYRRRMVKRDAEYFFTHQIFHWNYRPWIVSFLLAEDERHIEKAVEWYMEFGDSEQAPDVQLLPLEITNKTWVVKIFGNHGVMTCPQTMKSCSLSHFKNVLEYRDINVKLRKAKQQYEDAD